MADLESWEPPALILTRDWYQELVLWSRPVRGLLRFQIPLSVLRLSTIRFPRHLPPSRVPIPHLAFELATSRPLHSGAERFQLLIVIKSQLAILPTVNPIRFCSGEYDTQECRSD